jgi:hypothetical protein
MSAFQLKTVASTKQAREAPHKRLRLFKGLIS